MITGGTGLLGRQVVDRFQQNGWIVLVLGNSRAGGHIVKCNLLQREELQAQFDQFQPTIVVHCAANRRPDELEGDEGKAMAINAEMPRNVGELCRAQGAWMIHLSTNYVFDGTHAPYSEDATPNPVNTYAKSKLEGERMLMKSNPKAAVIRVPLLYGPIDSLDDSPVTTLLTTLRHQDAPKFDNWQQRFPTCTIDVARMLEAIATAYAGRGAEEPATFSGIFHWQANEEHTKYSMALEIARIAGIDSAKIGRLDSAPAPGSAPRPQFERMLCGRLEQLLGIEGNGQAFRSPFAQSLEDSLMPFLTPAERRRGAVAAAEVAPRRHAFRNCCSRCLRLFRVFPSTGARDCAGQTSSIKGSGL
jgi:S-adenosylmethionine synthetase